MKYNNVHPVLITEVDYVLIERLLRQSSGNLHAVPLAHELNRAIQVRTDAFPVHAIGLNSRVIIRDTETQSERSVTVVLPAHASERQGRVSILSPMGIALLGFREGEEIVVSEQNKPEQRFTIAGVSHA